MQQKAPGRTIVRPGAFCRAGKPSRQAERTDRQGNAGRRAAVLPRGGRELGLLCFGMLLRGLFAKRFSRVFLFVQQLFAGSHRCFPGTGFPSAAQTSPSRRARILFNGFFPVRKTWKRDSAEKAGRRRFHNSACRHKFRSCSTRFSRLRGNPPGEQGDVYCSVKVM